MALMCLTPLSGQYEASLPHVLKSSGDPPVPNPILESQEPQSFCSLPRMPNRALEWELELTTLNPSMLH